MAEGTGDVTPTEKRIRKAPMCLTYTPLKRIKNNAAGLKPGESQRLQFLASQCTESPRGMEAPEPAASPDTSDDNSPRIVYRGLKRKGDAPPKAPPKAPSRTRTPKPPEPEALLPPPEDLQEALASMVPLPAAKVMDGLSLRMAQGNASFKSPGNLPRDDGCSQRVTSAHYARMGRFQAPRGFCVRDTPSTVSDSVMKRSKIAHKFGDGWAIGTYRNKYIGPHAARRGCYCVYYNESSEFYYHELQLADYGAEKLWVIVDRAKNMSSGSPKSALHPKSATVRPQGNPRNGGCSKCRYSPGGCKTCRASPSDEVQELP